MNQMRLSPLPLEPSGQPAVQRWKTSGTKSVAIEEGVGVARLQRRQSSDRVGRSQAGENYKTETVIENTVPA